MPLKPIECVEAFHLAFLRILEVRLDRSHWVVKGGVNLRAWFGSQRYSEDLDIDAVRGQSHVLREQVDEVLASKAFRDLLAIQKIALVSSRKTKQTETTQRWKFEIQTEGTNRPLPTKVEFSRRGRQGDYLLEPVRPDVVRPYGIPAPTVNHYTPASAIHQKIEALALRSEVQARDIWDLDHLFRIPGIDATPLPKSTRETLPQAIERALEVGYSEFKAQVVALLAPDHQETYGSRDAWENVCLLVNDRLEELSA